MHGLADLFHGVPVLPARLRRLVLQVIAIHVSAEKNQHVVTVYARRRGGTGSGIRDARQQLLHLLRPGERYVVAVRGVRDGQMGVADDDGPPGFNVRHARHKGDAVAVTRLQLDLLDLHVAEGGAAHEQREAVDLVARALEEVHVEVSAEPLQVERVEARGGRGEVVLLEEDDVGGKCGERIADGTVTLAPWDLVERLADAGRRGEDIELDQAKWNHSRTRGGNAGAAGQATELPRKSL